MGDPAEVRAITSKRALLLQWFGLLAAPTAWFVHLQVGYVLGGWACAWDTSWLVHATTLGALALCGAGLAASLVAWRATGRPRDAGGGGAFGRARLMALAGIAFSAFFALIVLTAGAIEIALEPCGAS